MDGCGKARLPAAAIEPAEASHPFAPRPKGVKYSTLTSFSSELAAAAEEGSDLKACSDTMSKELVT